MHCIQARWSHRANFQEQKGRGLPMVPSLSAFFHKEQLLKGEWKLGTSAGVLKTATKLAREDRLKFYQALDEEMNTPSQRCFSWMPKAGSLIPEKALEYTGHSNLPVPWAVTNRGQDVWWQERWRFKQRVHPFWKGHTGASLTLQASTSSLARSSFAIRVNYSLGGIMALPSGKPKHSPRTRLGTKRML